MFRPNFLFSTGLAGLVGCFIGTYYEKHFTSSSKSVINSLTESKVQPLPVVLEPKVGGQKKYIYKPDWKQQDLDQTRMLSIMQHGFPSIDGLRQFRNFVLSYDRRHRNANWVLEHLTPENFTKSDNKEKSNRSNFEFFEDLHVHEYFRANNNDFRRSGYDRGHLAPAGNYKFSNEDCFQTFILSNISPQVGIGFNRGIWNKLENYIRYRVNGCKNVWVCTGPLYLSQQAKDGRNYVMYEVIGQNNVAVPTHFFKVILSESLDSQFDLECYLMANKNVDANLPLQAFQVPLDVIERASGLLIFEKLPKSKLRSINGPNKFLTKFEQKFINKK